jgi:hypothetical protein
VNASPICPPWAASNIAPQQIESALGRDDLIDQVVVGNRRKYIVAHERGQICHLRLSPEKPARRPDP